MVEQHWTACDFCSKDISNEYHNTVESTQFVNRGDRVEIVFCYECANTLVIPWLESQKKNIKPTV